eukprot:m.17057 g.17057  ORF g.17057 m.17057 type:complete len:525 (-) comp10924_c0_seq1:16-1590(-)
MKLVLLVLCAAVVYAKPNFLLLFIDDCGFCDVGYCDKTVLTPHLTDLAMSGIRFSSHHTWNWCAPSRGQLMSGRYAPNNGYMQGGDGGTDTRALPLNFTLLPAVLKTAGYKTYAAGKYHLGYPTNDYLPTSRGFDSWLGYLTGAEDYYWHNQTHGGCAARDLWSDGGPVTDPKHFPEYSIFTFANQLIKNIEEHDPEHPFFIYAPFQSIHSPPEVPQRFVDLYKDDLAKCAPFERDPKKGYQCKDDDNGDAKNCFCTRLIVKARMSALDEAIANITAALKQKGMWEDTIVVFSGDNGGPEFYGHWNGGLRGEKFSQWQGGITPAGFIHSPLIPAHRQGTWFNHTMHETDWLPTFAALAGAELPPYQIDGRNAWDAVINGSSYRNETLLGIATITIGQYKLFAENPSGTAINHGCILGTNGGWIAAPPSSSKNLCPSITCSDATTSVDKWLCSNPCSMESPCLYDLANDPLERNDIAANNPDIVSKMLTRLKELQKDYFKPTWLPDNGKFCDKMKERGGYVGPWL